jgi:hypothetical protein
MISYSIEYNVRLLILHNPDRQLGDTYLDGLFKSTMDRINAAMNHLQRLTPLSLGRKPNFGHMPDAIGHDNLDDRAFPIHNLPTSKTKVFVGRGSILLQLDEYFRGSQSSASTESLRVFSLWGLGGVGKTELALKYARNHRADYQAIFWIRSDSVKSLQHEFTQLAVDLQLPGANRTGDHETHECNLSLVKRWLRITRKYQLVLECLD